MLTLKKKLEEKSFSSINEIYDFLDTLGFEEIGNGLYARCYSKPSLKYVIKVFDALEDEGYNLYLSKIEKIKNKYTPKIFYVVNAKFTEQGTPKRIKFVILEKLHEYSKIGMGKCNTIIKKYFGCYIDEMQYKITDDCISSYDEQLRYIVEQIYDISQEWEMDIHDGNIMYRKSKKSFVPVFTDPICSC